MGDTSDKKKDKICLEPGKLSTNRDVADDLKDIDDLHDSLLPSYLAAPAAVTDDLDDALFAAGKDDEAMQAAPAVLEGIDDSQYYVLRARPGWPDEDDITFETEDGAETQTVPLAGFRCVRSATRLPQFAPPDTPGEVERIETDDGKHYDLCVPEEQRLASGIFAFSTRHDILGHAKVDQYYFFPLCNIKQRYRKGYFGELLIEKGMLDNVALQEALDEQKRRRSRKLGQIIAEEASIPQEVVDEEIREAIRENKPVRVGEILVEAGLVDKELVRQALKIQKQLKKKIGELLIEKGRLSDEQIFSALAEKFRMKFVDLREEAFSKEALALMPREAVRKFLLLPVTFRGDSLVVATMVPDSPAVRQVIHKYTRRRDIQLVLVRPSQLRLAIRQLYV